MKPFENIIAWQRAHKFVLEIYRISSLLPDIEKFGLTSQLKRAVSSVPLNIVEGRARNSTKDYLRFLYQAKGSLEECEYILILIKNPGYITIDIRSEVAKPLQSLMNALRTKII